MPIKVDNDGDLHFIEEPNNIPNEEKQEADAEEELLQELIKKHQNELNIAKQQGKVKLINLAGNAGADFGNFNDGNNFDIINDNQMPIELFQNKKAKLKKEKLVDGMIYTIEGEIKKEEDCVETMSGWLSKEHKHLYVDYVSGKLEYKPNMQRITTAIDFTKSPWLITTDLTMQWPTLRILSDKEGRHYSITKQFVEANPDITEDLATGFFVYKNVIPRVKPQYLQHVGTNLEHLTLTPSDCLKYGIKTTSYRAFEGKQYTFGIEAETFTGKVPTYLYSEYHLNWDAIYDGSLKDDDGNLWGGEYVSGILKGDTGVLQIEKMFYELSRRCSVNEKCSLHAHIGNVDFNKSFLLHMYELARLIQDEVFQLLPQTRRDNEFCRKLPNLYIDLKPLAELKGDLYDLHINESYNAFFKWLNTKGISPSKDCNRHTDHPYGYKCHYDKKTARYSWINFNPCVFDTRKTGWSETFNEDGGHIIRNKRMPVRTIEFRPHSGTLNFNKTLMWLKICMAIVYFAENHQKSIQDGGITLYIDENGSKVTTWLPVSLRSIIITAYPKTHSQILAYIEERKKKFSVTSASEAQRMEATEYKKQSIDKIKRKNLKEIVCA